MKVKDAACLNIDFSESKQVFALIKNLVRDENMCKVLFGIAQDRSFKEKNIDEIHEALLALERTINMSFVMVYSRWKQLYSNWESKYGTEAEYNKLKKSRFTQIFLSVLDYEEITLDLAVFALIEVWVSAHSDGEISRMFFPIFNIRVEDLGVTLQEALRYITLAKKNFLDLSHEHIDYADATKLLCEVLVCFGYSQLSIYPEKKYEIMCDIFGDIILKPAEIVNGAEFLCDRNGLSASAGVEVEDDDEDEEDDGVLFMLVAKSQFCDTATYFYRSIDGQKHFRMERKAESQSEDVREEEAAKNLKKFYSFNYKNLREFTLVISDAVIKYDTAKLSIFNYCKRKNPALIEHYESHKSPDIFWDNLIALLLLEQGVTDFLRNILDKDLFDLILRNIAYRHSTNTRCDSLVEEGETGSRALMEKYGYNRTLYEKRRNKLYTRLIMEAMELNFPRVSDIDSSNYEESLNLKYDKMLNYINILKDKTTPNEIFIKKRDELCQLLREIFIFLISFYYGIDSYAMRLENSTVDKNADSQASRMKLLELEQKFVEGARRKYIGEKDKSLVELYNDFRNMCLTEYSNNSGINKYFTLNPKTKRLKLVLTRNYVCDVTKLDYFVDIYLDDGSKSNIFEMLENISDSKYIRNENFTTWLDYFKDFFLFLVYNEDYDRRGGFSNSDMRLSDKDYDPIYPYVVSYYKQNIDRDMMFKKCSYKVPIPSNNYKPDEVEDGIVVTLLTDDDYDVNRKYFCIPLRYGSTENWWINPFLIPTDVYKDIMNVDGVKNASCDD